MYYLAHFCGETVPGDAENVPPGALLREKRAKVIKKYRRFRIRRSGNPGNLPNMSSLHITYFRSTFLLFNSPGPTVQQSGARRAFRARARRSARSVAAGGRIFRLRCWRSAIFEQTASSFGPPVLPAGNCQQTTSDFVAAWWRRHRRQCQFRYFGSPMYLLGAKCDPISTKIGVKRTYWRIRRPNKYIFLFSAGFLLRTRQAPFLC